MQGCNKHHSSLFYLLIIQLFGLENHAKRWKLFKACFTKARSWNGFFLPSTRFSFLSERLKKRENIYNNNNLYIYKVERKHFLLNILKSFSKCRYMMVYRDGLDIFCASLPSRNGPTRATPRRYRAWRRSASARCCSVRSSAPWRWAAAWCSPWCRADPRTWPTSCCCWWCWPCCSSTSS